MTTLTPTRFRQRLFSTLHRALSGEKIAIHTREGDVFLSSEKKHSPRRRGGKGDPLAPKLPGWIVGNLDDADEAMRRYIRLP